METDPAQLEYLKKSAKKVLPKENLVKTNSFDLSEIKGLIFGGQSSRFWILRRHVNALDKSKFYKDELPFYAWQCLTLQLENREIDLVIKDEKEMD